MVEAPSTPPPTADGGVPTAFEWSTTLELLDHRGISKFVTGPIPNFAVVPNPGGGTGTDGGA